MLKNHIKTAWRNLKANRFYSLLHISGLAIGLATAIMLLLWTQNEQSYDKFHSSYRNIYNISAHFVISGKEVTWTGVPGPLAVYARSMPQVQSLVRINNTGEQVVSDAGRHKTLGGNKMALVDSNFFAVFDFPLLQGNKETLFPNNNSIVITQSMAKKFFENEHDAMGKVLTTDNNNFTVTGILKNFPENSSLQFDAIVPMGYYARQFTEQGGNGDWKTIDEDLGNYAFQTFVQLQAGADPVKAGNDFTQAYKKARNGSGTQFKLQNLGDMHLTGADGNDAPLKMVRIFILVAALLLLIASINYVNLSTARSLVRAKEVSIRKIVGAEKRQLFVQFITETLLLFGISTIIAILLIALLKPLYNNISGKNLSFSFADLHLWKVIGISIAGTIIAVSIYPALVLSSFHPLQSLKGKIMPGMGRSMFRKILVVFQFTVSVVLIISTMMISRQMKYIREKNLGYDKSYVFTVPLPGDAVKHVDAITSELMNNPDIANVSAAGIADISNLDMRTGDIEWPGKPRGNNMFITMAPVDKGFIPTMKIEFLEGKNFTGLPSDNTSYILNETAVKEMGLQPPYVGQEISLQDEKGTIIGVVKDFHFKSLKEKISPLLFFNQGWERNILYVRTIAGKTQQAIAAVKSRYEKYAGNVPFSYGFVDKQFEAKYRSDLRAGALFNGFAAIAIFISCLGLFGLATYTAQVRTKEIGVRKVLGANIGNIVNLLAKDFIVLVLLAIVIAVPLAWWSMSNWLQEFAYRTEQSWWIFLLAGFTAVVIALVTVSFQAIKAAVANPVKSLRTE